MNKVLKFLRKWWLALAAGVVLIALFIRRAVVLRTLSDLRRRISAREAAIQDQAAAQAVATHTEAIEAHAANIRAEREAIEQLNRQVEATGTAHQRILEAIDNAKDWEELNRLREEANKR